MPNLKPIVEPIDNVVMINDTIAVSSFFTAFDPDDGDEITKYMITDTSAAGASGFFVFQGQIQSNGATLVIDADELDDLLYRGGPVVGNEFIRIQAFDGELYSDQVVAKAYTARAESTKPIAVVNDTEVLGNEMILASSFISGFDPDGFPIVGYSIRDKNIDKSFFSLDGEALEQGVFHNLSVAEFERLYYNGVGRREEPVEVRVFDGTVSSAIGSGIVNTKANLNRPVVDFGSVMTVQGELVPVAPLVVTSDADENTIKTIELRDRNDKPFSGYLMFRGETLAAKEWHSFTPDEIDEVFFVGGERNIVEQVRVFATDGRFRSQRETFMFDNSSNGSRPEVTVVDDVENVQSHLEYVAMSEIFKLGSVGTGGPVVAYEVVDLNTDPLSSQLVLDGSVLEAGVIHSIAPGPFELPLGQRDEPFDGLNVLTGTYEFRHLDQFMVRPVKASGVRGEWVRANVRSEPEFSNALFFPFSPVFSFSWTDVYRFIGKPTDPIQISYSFMQQFPDYETGEAIDAPDNDPPEPFFPFLPNQRAATRRALALLESYANIEFIEVSDSIANDVSFSRGGVMRFGNYTLYDPDAAAAFAFFPGLSPQAGDIWINSVQVNVNNFDEGTFAFTTLLHEIGHAIGFSHPFVEVDGPQKPALPFSTDSDLFTVMSYTSRGDGLSPATFQLYDVYQTQMQYGVNENYATGDDMYSVDTFVLGPNSAITIWDAAGNDTLSAEGTSNNAVVDLRDGAISSIGNFSNNIAIAFGAMIENATGGDGDDMLSGNELQNVIYGGAGNDTIRGYGANDKLSGGFGGDRYIFSVADGNNTIDEMKMAGRDTIEFEEFPGLNDLTDDFVFRLEGRDLVVSLALDSQSAKDTTVRIIDQTRGSSRIETLEIGSTRIDLDNLTQQASGADQRFQLTEESSVFGNLVTPVV